MQIQDITLILSNNYEINNLTKKTWDLFLNHIIQYKNEYYRIKRYNNKSLMVDFYRRSFHILKNMDNEMKKLSLSDKNDEIQVKDFIDKLIIQFLKFNMKSIKEL